MATKFPVNGNRVPDPRRGALVRRLRDEDRGIALISVVAILVLLAIVATPFLVSMRDSAARGQRFLYSAQADWEAESLFERVRSHLILSLEHVERRRLDELGPAVGAASPGGEVTRPGAGLSPTSDTTAEYALPAGILEDFNRDKAREQRVWDVDIVDLQGRLNANNCSYPVLANILGRTELIDELTSEQTRVPLADASVFPKDGGVVRIGDEVIRYEQVAGNELVNCERGYMTEDPCNGGAGDWEVGDVVVLESAFQIATRPFRARAGAFVRYTNPYQLRQIADLGVASLSPVQLDALRPHVTTWNGNIVGDGWSNPQVIRNAITAADSSQRYVEIKNNRYFGAGTMVRITDGVNNDYGVVTKVRGANQVLIVGDIKNDYSGDQGRIYALSRSPVNVNVADVDLLALVFSGLRVRGRGDRIDAGKARELATFLKETYTARGEDEPGVYRNWEDLTNALEYARDEVGILTDDQFRAVMLNGMNANDSVLSFSTVPFVFRSFDLYEITATAAILDSNGQELARRRLRRVFHASSTRSGTFVVETQDDFQRHIMKSRDSKWFATFPDNINAYYDGPNIPASEYRAFAQKSRFPSTDRADGVGHVALLPGSRRFTQRGSVDRVHHFDGSDIPDGQDLSVTGLSFAPIGPYSVKDKQADLLRLIDIEGVGNDIELGMRPFALSFWYRPDWSRGGGDQVIFDYGVEFENTNRVSLRYLSDDDVLALSVADGTIEAESCEVLYEFDHTTWEAGTWYHIGVNVNGCHPSLLELFIDGEKQGTASCITRLTTPVAPTGDIPELSVEDASTFPDAGVLLVRSRRGAELFEYTRRTDSKFVVSRRKARSIDLTAHDDELRGHDSGAIVELYGFAAPLLCDVLQGGAQLSSAIGPWRCYRFFYGGQQIVHPTTGVEIAQGLAGTSQHQFPIAGITLTEWDTGDTSTDILDDLGGQDAEGLALLVSYAGDLDFADPTLKPLVGPGGTAPVGQGDDQSITVGGVELVAYRVTGIDQGTGAEVSITARGLESRHWAFEPNGSDGLPRFHPTYTFHDDTATPPLDSQNLYSAFIPVAIATTRATGEYLDPADEEPQIGGFAYVQINGEWVKYDTYDTDVFPSGNLSAFYRDTRWDEIAGLFPGAGNYLSAKQTTTGGTTGGEGGLGAGSSPDSQPPVAEDLVALAPDPTEPQLDTSSGLAAPPMTAFQIAQQADFRGMLLPSQELELHIANTVPSTHASGDSVDPTFRVRAGNDLTNGPGARLAYPGFNDLLTFRDAEADVEQVRVQWGYNGWAALKDPVTSPWFWDRPQGSIDLSRFDSRYWTRVLKFPSREMPDAELTQSSNDFAIGVSFDGGTSSPATIDELWFADVPNIRGTRADYAFLGEVPASLDPNAAAQAQQNGTEQPEITLPGIDENADEISVNFPFFDVGAGRLVFQGLPIEEDLFDSDGGIIRIDDEIILYGDFDPGTGVFSDCVRGAFGTEPIAHEYGAIVCAVRTFATSVLTGDGDASAAAFDLLDARDFPDAGYIRIGESGEMIGYTERIGNTLSGPLGRIDPTTTRPDRSRSGSENDARTGGGIFRGRFGTAASGFGSGELAVSMPFRHYDRYAEYSDDAEMSYVQLSWTKPGAIWKRITWDEDPRQNIEVIALVRFAGGPPWDTVDVIDLEGGEAVPRTQRHRYLYSITKPENLNLLNVESDRVEVRLLVRFARGAYDRFAEVAPDNWKESPWVQKVTVEYVAPPQVVYEDK